MKKIISSTVHYFLYSSAKTQNITPSQSTDVCPGVNITFSVSIPGQGVTSVSGVALNVAPTVIQQPFNVSVSGGNVTFDFTGRFADYNNKQTFRVNYTNSSGQAATWDATFPKIKSLLTAYSCSQVFPSPTMINVPRCQTGNFNISFSNVQYGNPFESPQICYGTITNYEYLLPTGWSLGGITSNGSNWIAGGNNVTVTSDLSTGDGSVIKIRPVNTSCTTGLTFGQEAYVNISRPQPTLSISSNQFTICSGSADFTINGMPDGATVQWSLSNTTDASIVGCSTCTTVTVARNTSYSTIVSLKATVTHCTFTYEKEADITLGNPFTAWPYVIGPDPECLQMGGPVLYGAIISPPGASVIWGYIEGQYSGTINYVDAGGLNQATITIPNNLQNNQIYVAVQNDCGTGVPAIEAFEYTEDCGPGQEWRKKPAANDDSDKMESGFKLFPNPPSNQITFQVPNEYVGKSILYITDLNGRIRLRLNVLNSIQTINISHLNNGFYLLRLVGNSKFHSLKFIKNK
jgi:hypothetical protein